MNAAESTNMETLKRMSDGFNNKDIDSIMANFTEDAVFETSQGPYPWGVSKAGNGQLETHHGKHGGHEI